MRSPAKIMREVALLMAAMALAVLLAALPAQAATTFTVNTTNDASDANTTDGVCSTAAGQCTLRAAIEQANALAGDDVIEFAPSVSGTIVLGGDELYIDSNLKINGPGADVLSVSGGDPRVSRGSRVFDVAMSYVINGVLHGTTVEISGLTIRDGFCDDGCGIRNKGTLTISDSTITGNKAVLSDGGGLTNYGTLKLERSTISGNTAAERGGGIYSYTWAHRKTTITNSTISGNTANGTGWYKGGGGVYNDEGLTEIEHSTITNNTAAAPVGGGVASHGSDPNSPDALHPGNITLTEVYSSIISGNTNTDVDLDFGSFGTFGSLGYNLIGDGNSTSVFNQSGDRTGVADPALEALSLNGGPTHTHAIKAASPALNTGPSSTQCPPPATDQRGVTRPQEGTCDIGSFEREDVTAPDAPIITSPRSGSLNPGSFSVSGIAEAGAKVELFEGAVSQGKATANSSGGWSIVLTGVTDGSHSYKAKATDAAGNVSAESEARTITVDATVPNAPVITSPADGTYYNRGNCCSVIVSGTAEARARIELYDAGNKTPYAAPADAEGKWAMKLTSVSEGSHSYTVKATDLVGNTSAESESRTVIVDPRAPEAPSITSPAQDARLNYRSFSLSGTAEKGAKVELFEGVLSKGTATADPYGKWKVALSGVSEGTHSYTAKATDQAGNTSAPSGTRTVIVDTIKPKVSSVDPAENATAVVPDANIYVTFSEAMKATTINTTSFQLYKQGSTTPITASVSYDPIAKKATLNPYPNSYEYLEPEVTYKAVITTEAKDLAGNALDQDPTLTGNQNKVWYFKVVFDPTLL